MRELVIAVHPDDETLAMGGTILKHKRRGDDIYWVIITSMEDEEERKKRKAEIDQANARYKFNGIFELNMPAAGLNESYVPRIIEQLDSIAKEIKPETVYIPWCYDLHSDHRTTYQACCVFLKPHRYPYIRNVFAMEVLSETDLGAIAFKKGYTPNYFIDITDTIEEKLDILDIYKTETGQFPFPRSRQACMALAQLRGQTIGVKYAEAFLCLKQVEK